MGKRKRKHFRLIKYFLFALWLASFLITIRVYRQAEITYQAINPKTKKVIVRTVKEGYSFQQILAIYLVIGALLSMGSLFFGGNKDTPGTMPVRRHRNAAFKPRLRPNFFFQPSRCPKCLAYDVHRSRRVDLEWTLALFLIAPFRCRSCFSRFYRFAFLAKK